MGLNRHKRRAPRLLAAGAVGAALLAGGGVGARADVAVSDAEARLQNVVVEELELADAPLTVAITLIKRQVPVNLVLIPTGNGKPYGKVFVSLRRQPLPDVLRLVAESAGADLWQKDGVFFVGPKGSAPRREPVFNPALELPDPVIPSRYEKIKLQYISPQAVLRAMGISQGPRGDAYDLLYQNVMRYVLYPETSNNPRTLTPVFQNNFSLQPPVYAPQQAAPAVPTAAPSVPTGPQSQPTPRPNGVGYDPNALLPNSGNGGDQGANRSGEAAGEFGRGGQGFPGGGGFGGGGAGGFGGQPGGGGAGGFGGQPGGGGAGGQGQQGGAASNLLPQGIQAGDILANDADGSLIIGPGATPSALPRLRELIRLLDVKPLQIMVKAEFITLSQNDQSTFGINWQLQRVNFIAGVNAGFSATSTAFIQYATGNIQTQLSFILTQGRGKLVASPMATTLNNVPVSFSQTTLIPFFQTTTSFAGVNGQPVLATILQQIPATTGLFILPRANGDGSLTLLGTVFLTDLGDTVTGPNGETFPVIVTQSAPIQRILRNGETLVIAGLTRKNQNVSQNKVPLLGDLPLIGSLFRSRNVSTSDSDLLVFITASIIPERGGFGAGAGSAPGGPSGGGNPLLAPPSTGPGSGNP